MLPERISQWLHDRTLSNQTIEKFKIGWNGRQIVIPVHDEDGNYLFNKYRRDPHTKNETTPKYQYDYGASVVLFNSQTLKEAKDYETIFIAEGELDCIALENIGLRAVTTTGGAGTFDASWAEHFKRFENVIICFDNDLAGVRGAIYAQGVVPHAKMLFLPAETGKDVTDYLVECGRDAFFKLEPEHYDIPSDLEDTTDKTAVRKKIREFAKTCDELQQRRREMTAKRIGTIHLDIMIEYAANRYETYKLMERRLVAPAYQGDRSKVEQARAVPMPSLIKFNRQKYAPCIAHAEKTASMFYNDEKSKYPNTVKCFGGCGWMGDPIDVVMHLRGVSFKEAVEILT